MYTYKSYCFLNLIGLSEEMENYLQTLISRLHGEKRFREITFKSPPKIIIRVLYICNGIIENFIISANLLQEIKSRLPVSKINSV